MKKTKYPSILNEYHYHNSGSKKFSEQGVPRFLLPLTSKPGQVPVLPQAHWLTAKQTLGSIL
jgi:hypothetical protein